MDNATPRPESSVSIPLVVALDGPAGSGKSTVARRVAAALGWRYVDTGASYRAMTLAVLRAGADPADAEAVVRTAQAARVELLHDPRRPGVRLDGIDVSEAVRGADVTAAVSAVSAVPALRALLVTLQRAAIGHSGAVAEGRDVATVVVPDAPVKVYLDADPVVRAGRRAAEVDAGVRVPTDQAGRHEAVARDLARRDALDSGRAASPLLAADDAFHLDSTALDVDEVVARVLSLVAAAGLGSR